MGLQNKSQLQQQVGKLVAVLVFPSLMLWSRNCMFMYFFVFYYTVYSEKDLDYMEEMNVLMYKLHTFSYALLI